MAQGVDHFAHQPQRSPRLEDSAPPWLLSQTGIQASTETVALGVLSRRSPISGARLGEDSVDVCLHCVVAQEERGRDLGIGQAVSQQGKNLRLAARKTIRQISGCRCMRCTCGGKKRRLDLRVQNREAGDSAVQRLSDVKPVGVLRQVAACPGSERLQDRSIVGVSGEHDDGHLGVFGGQAPSRFDSVQHRHVQIEQNGVRVTVAHLLESLLSVGRRADHVDIGQQVEHEYQAFADTGLVVGDDDPQRRQGPLSPVSVLLRRFRAARCLVAGARHRGTRAVTTH